MEEREVKLSEGMKRVTDKSEAGLSGRNKENSGKREVREGEKSKDGKREAVRAVYSGKNCMPDRKKNEMKVEGITFFQP